MALTVLGQCVVGHLDQLHEAKPCRHLFPESQRWAHLGIPGTVVCARCLPNLEADARAYLNSRCDCCCHPVGPMEPVNVQVTADLIVAGVACQACTGAVPQATFEGG